MSKRHFYVKRKPVKPPRLSRREKLNLDGLDFYNFVWPIEDFTRFACYCERDGRNPGDVLMELIYNFNQRRKEIL